MYKIKLINGTQVHWMSTSQKLFKWVWKSENDRIFKRKYLDTALTFKDGDYAWIKAIESLGDCYEILVEVYKSDVKVYDGYFGCNTGMWNNLECYAEIKIEPNDQYRCLLDNINTKVNILQEVAPIDVDIEVAGEGIEYVSYIDYFKNDNNWFFTYYGGAFNLGSQTNASSLILGGYKYNSSQAPYPFYIFDTNSYSTQIGSQYWCWYSSEGISRDYYDFKWRWKIKTTLARKYSITLNDSYGNPVVPAGTWYDAGAVTYLGQLANKWVQPLYDNYQQPNFDIQGKVYKSSAANYFSIHTYNGITTSYTTDSARLVSEIIDKLTENCVDGVTSDFLFNSVNYVTGLPNKLNSLCFVQNTDLKYITASDPATVGEMTLEYVLDILETTLNVKWFVDYRYDALTDSYSSRLRIEHITWFFDKSEMFDLTVIENGKYLGASYTYLDTLIPKIETWRSSYYSGMDFAPNDIIYTGSCRSGEDVEYMADVTLDVGSMINSSNAEDNGWSLIATQNTANNNIVINEQGERSGNLTTNGHLSWSNLLANYHLTWRYLRDGLLNNQVYQFTYLRPDKVQEVTFINCDEDIEDGKIKTDMGYGWVKTATKEDNYFKITIEYGKDIQ